MARWVRLILIGVCFGLGLGSLFYGIVLAVWANDSALCEEIAKTSTYGADIISQMFWVVASILIFLFFLLGALGVFLIYLQRKANKRKLAENDTKAE